MDNNAPLTHRVHEDHVWFVRSFCDWYSVKLTHVDITAEREFPEPIYFFSDRLGGYTIEGIRASVD